MDEPIALDDPARCHAALVAGGKVAHPSEEKEDDGFYFHAHNMVNPEGAKCGLNLSHTLWPQNSEHTSLWREAGSSFIRTCTIV